MVMLCRLCPFVLVITILCSFSLNSGVLGIGVNYGLVADNLPPPEQVVTLLKSRGIKKIRIFEPNQQVLTALQNSGIQAIVGVRNEDLQQLASDPTVAKQWITNNIIPHLPSLQVTCIGVGNEVIPSELATYVLGAMQNFDSALKSMNLEIPVTTAISMQAIGASSPPSAGVFSESSSSVMGPISSFLSARNYPLLVNVYPYFAYVSNPSQIPLTFALLTDTAGAPVVDGELVYHNLFDAMVDAVYSAMEKVGVRNVEIVVSETGWPSGGDGNANIENARTYAGNVVAHQRSAVVGTPKRPGKAVETYLFALFNEDLKSAGVEQNFGLYYPNMNEVYHVDF